MNTVGAFEPTVQCGVEPLKGKLAVVAGTFPAAAGEAVAGEAEEASFEAPVFASATLWIGAPAGKFAVRRLD
jgi:hypothetical protein